MQKKIYARQYQTGFVRRYLALGLITVFGYLCEVCIIPYVHPFGVSPNLLYVIIFSICILF